MHDYTVIYDSDVKRLTTYGGVSSELYWAMTLSPWTSCTTQSP